MLPALVADIEAALTAAATSASRVEPSRLLAANMVPASVAAKDIVLLILPNAATSPSLAELSRLLAVCSLPASVPEVNIPYAVISILPMI